MLITQCAPVSRPAVVVDLDYEYRIKTSKDKYYKYILISGAHLPVETLSPRGKCFIISMMFIVINIIITFSFSY